MTETSPLGSVARASSRGDRRGRLAAARVRRQDRPRASRSGSSPTTGSEVPWDGEQTGEVEIRGPWICSAYFKDPAPEKFDDGWLRTGDVAAIDPVGYIAHHRPREGRHQIRRRVDLTVGSERGWPPTQDFEVAVIAQARRALAGAPAGLRRRRGGASRSAPRSSLDFPARPRGEAGGSPTRYAFIDEVPKTSVGKFDKKVLRGRLAEGELTDRHTVTPVSA